jgi:hypothetical protein
MCNLFIPKHLFFFNLNYFLNQNLCFEHKILYQKKKKKEIETKIHNNHTR